MLKSENIFVKGNLSSLKDASFPVRDYVVTLIRQTELQRQTGKKSWTDGITTLASAHPGADYMSMSDTDVIVALGSDAADWLKTRAEIADLKAEIATLPVSYDQVTSLKPADRHRIELFAHMCYSSVVLSGDLFSQDKEGSFDLTSPIKLYYQGKGMSKIKEQIMPALYAAMGLEGDYFYGVKTRKSYVDESDLRHFLTRFSGKARREKKTATKDGVKTVSFSDFNYVLKAGDRRVQNSAFTELCAVVLDNAAKHAVITPETAEKAEEKQD